MKIVACNSNVELARAISSYIGVKLADASIRKFADHEIFVEINENIRGEDVFQSGTPESFNVLIKEIRSLGLNIELSNLN